MEKLKKPFIKSSINSLKKVFNLNKKQHLPKQLFADTKENENNINLIKPIFKQNRQEFEQDLQALFSHISQNNNFNNKFSFKNKFSLSYYVDEFFEKYGKPAKLENPIDLFEGISLHLSNSIKSKIRKIKKEEKEEYSFSEEETFKLENYREQLLNNFSSKENFSDETFGFLFKIAYKEFSSCSLNKIKNFIEAIQEDIQDKTKLYTDEIKQLEIQKITSKDKTLDRNIRYYKNILNYYKSAELIEHSSIFVRNKSLLNQPDNILTLLIDKKIDISKFQKDLTTLQQVNNLLVCINTGLLNENIFFNGENFVCNNSSFSRFPFLFGNGLKIVEQLSNLDRKTQSILAYNEETIPNLISKEKFPVTKITLPCEKGQTKELTLYSTEEIKSANQLENCSFPMFIKSFTYSSRNETAELMLFAVAGPDISLSTQICRIDKVPPFLRSGDVSKHEQVSGEMVDSNTHIHSYNLFDKVINSTPKNIGYFDIAANFNLNEQISNEELEAFFDNWCNLPSESLQQTYITQTKEYEKLLSEQPKIAESNITEFLQDK